jgi:hypothetical protein
MAFKITVALGAAALLQAGPAHGAQGTPPMVQTISPVKYDLSDHRISDWHQATASINLGARDLSIGRVTRQQAEAAAAGSAPPERPAVSYELVASGPVIELGAFGSKRMDVPGLAHFAVNWGC